MLAQRTADTSHMHRHKVFPGVPCGEITMFQVCNIAVYPVSAAHLHSVNGCADVIAQQIIRNSTESSITSPTAVLEVRPNLEQH